MVQLGVVFHYDMSDSYDNVGRSHDRLDVYIRNIAVCFASIHRSAGNRYLEFVIFTNVAFDNHPMYDVLTALNVKIVPLENTHRPPTDYAASWQGTFLYLDALNHLASAMNPQDVVILLDPDCICVGSLESIVTTIQKDGVLNYRCDYSADYSVNGLSRHDMRQLILEEDGLAIKTAPDHFGGEIYGILGTVIGRFCYEAECAWQLSLKRYSQGKSRFFTEEHLFNYVFWKMGLSYGNGNDYIRRIWTSIGYRNVRKADVQLSIWHIPAEKERTLLQLSLELSTTTSPFWILNSSQFKNYVGRKVGIPHPTLSYCVKETWHITSKIYGWVCKSLGRGKGCSIQC